MRYKSGNYLIILGAGPQQVIAYKTASKLGIKTIAIDFNPQAVAGKIADIFVLADIKKPSDCIKQLKKLKLKFSGVITLGAEVSFTVSKIAQAFHLRAVDPKTALNTTNKYLRYKILKKYKVPIPNFLLAKNNQLPKLKFPFIVKPSDNSGCRGVQLVSNQKEWLKAYWEAKKLSSDNRVVVEEFLTGQEISIEGFILNNKLYITGFADRNFIPGYLPHFMEDGSSSPTLLDKKTVKAVERIFKKAVKSLGIKSGPTKGDIIVTKNGVKVFEITSRLSPGFSHILPDANGTDILEATIRWACKLNISKSLLMPKYNYGIAHRYFFHKPGIIKQIKGLKEIKNQPGVKVFMPLQNIKLGAKLTPPSFINRLFYIYTIGKNRNTAIKYARKALKSIKIKVNPI